LSWLCPGKLLEVEDAAAADVSALTSVHLSFPAKAEYITLGRLALTGLAKAQPMPEEALADLKVALSEACSNVVRHAYRDRRNGVVDISYELAAEQIAIEVADYGNGFAASELMDEEGELTEGGLGIAIIRALSDEFEVGKREDGGGVRLRFVKKL
jgi:serine/threonine-protein kinase RsbW